MYTIYQIDADDLDAQFLDSLKIMFKHKKIEIAVSEMDQVGTTETEFLLKTPANRRRLMDAIANADQEHGLVYMSAADLELLA